MNPLPAADVRLCENSPTGRHFHIMSSVLPAYTQMRTTCDICGQFVKIEGALWVKDQAIIVEEEHIEDYL